MFHVFSGTGTVQTCIRDMCKKRRPLKSEVVPVVSDAQPNISEFRGSLPCSLRITELPGRVGG